MGFIEADSEDTWPEPMQRALADRAGDIAAYQIERARIDRAAERDVALRLKRPINPHRPAWDAVLKVSDEAVAGRCLVGFHATRLTEPERQDIISNGLRVLSPNLLERRLEGIASALSADVVESLRARNQVYDGNRIGLAWFCFTRALLRDESGIERLFRSWGGEALYNSHEDDEKTGPTLAAIGKPCIVIARVPVTGIEAFMSIGQRLVNAWCARSGIKTGDGADFEGCVRADIPGGDIVRIPTLDDPEFRSLTAHDAWDTPLS
jgi:hypothetical protein